MAGPLSLPYLPIYITHDLTDSEDWAPQQSPQGSEPRPRNPQKRPTQSPVPERDRDRDTCAHPRRATCRLCDVRDGPRPVCICHHLASATWQAKPPSESTAAGFLSGSSAPRSECTTVLRQLEPVSWDDLCPFRPIWEGRMGDHGTRLSLNSIFDASQFRSGLFV